MLDRMKFAAQQLVERRRTPRVFYLLAEDWAEFEATDPPKIVHEFNGTPCEVASFEGLAVKPSDSKVRSMLYCTVGTSTMVPPR